MYAFGVAHCAQPYFCFHKISEDSGAGQNVKSNMLYNFFLLFSSNLLQCFSNMPPPPPRITNLKYCTAVFEGSHSLTLLYIPWQVRDAGRTEVEPGSKTVLAIGGVSETVDQVTGHLKTLR